MSSDLLRQYEPWECVREGYPQPWGSASVLTKSGHVYFGRTADLILVENVAERWPPIKDLIREQADHRCLRCGHPYPPEIADTHPRGEWTPCDERCDHGGPIAWFDGENYYDGLLEEKMDAMMARVANWRILTVHHLDEDKANCRWWNLASLCQRCHLRMQRAVVMDRVYHFEHSEWFKPFAAGFYAWKYLGEDLGREETLSRLPALLALEHRFTQEALL